MMTRASLFLDTPATCACRCRALGTRLNQFFAATRFYELQHDQGADVVRQGSFV
jgi:hypothetical protein